MLRTLSRNFILNSYCIPTIIGESGYAEIIAALEPAQNGEPAGSRIGRFGDVAISSHFQPIFSLSHRRIVGHEALMRGHGPGGRVRPTPDISQTSRVHHDHVE